MSFTNQQLKEQIKQKDQNKLSPSRFGLFKVKNFGPFDDYLVYEREVDTLDYAMVYACKYADDLIDDWSRRYIKQNPDYVFYVIYDRKTKKSFGVTWNKIPGKMSYFV
jgi:hypothetical protein